MTIGLLPLSVLLVTTRDAVFAIWRFSRRSNFTSLYKLPMRPAKLIWKSFAPPPQRFAETPIAALNRHECASVFMRDEWRDRADGIGPDRPISAGRGPRPEPLQKSESRQYSLESQPGSPANLVARCERHGRWWTVTAHGNESCGTVLRPSPPRTAPASG